MSSKTKPYEYAAALINGRDYKDLSGYPQQWKERARDALFLEVLESFNEMPIRVFQVGAIESLQNSFRIGSGWSELFWGAYINKHGGEMTVVDINLDHIAHSTFLSNYFKYKVNLFLEDAINVIDEGYDIYYLDGADIDHVADAHEQTLNMFKKIEHTNSVVLVDDVPTKAEDLIKYLNEKNIKFTEFKTPGSHVMNIDLRK